MELAQLCPSLDADDPSLAGSPFSFDVLSTAVEDSDDDDAWSDDDSVSSLSCGEVCISDVDLPRAADQHLRHFPGPTDAAATAIDLVQMTSTTDVPPTLPVDPLYALQHRCAHTKRSGLHIHGECERLIHQLKADGIFVPRAHSDGGASASTTNH